MAGFMDFLLKGFVIYQWRISIISIIITVSLLIIGFVLGKISVKILRKLSERGEINKIMRPSFIELFVVLVKWSIYLLFINLALRQLNLPQLTSWLGSILVVIPALIGALLLIAIGFIIATYLKDTIEESKVLNWKILSNTIFYFIFYVFLIFAFKTALISLDSWMVNTLIVIFTAIISVGTTFFIVKYSLRKK